MGTYILLSELTDEGAATIKERPERVKEVNAEIRKLGAEVKEQFAVLGPYDFVNIVEAPDEETITRVSVELGSRGTIKITTLTALPIDDFIQSFER
ncbi:MAG: GYD domain-containing protein [Candidatus Bipolaricaulota bacterium]